MSQLASITSNLFLGVLITLIASLLLFIVKLLIGSMPVERFFYPKKFRIENIIRNKYAKEKRESSLAIADHFPEKNLLPLLENNQTHYPVRLDPTEEEGVFCPKDTIESFPISNRLTLRNKIIGRRYSNSPILYAKDIDFKSGTINAGITRYRSAITFADKIYRQFQRKLFPSLSSLKLTDFETAMKSPLVRPMYIGSDAACAFKSEDNKWLIPMHVRSSKTINYPGSYTVTPAFTYESNRVAGYTSRFNLVAYNFFKEFLEEFWDTEEIVNLPDNLRQDPDWIFQDPHGRALVEELEAGRIDIFITGTAIDLTYCAVDVGLTALFHSPKYLTELRQAPGCGSEHYNKTGLPRIEFVDLFGEKMDSLFSKMKPSTAYSINKARSLLIALEKSAETPA